MAGWGEGEWLAGRYRLERRISQGGMGRVWQAYDKELHRAVAVKELLLPPGADEELRQVLVRRIRREARAAAALRHPGLVGVHDITTDGSGVPAVVMELVEGTPLDRLARRDGRLSPPLVSDIARQVLAALAAAHAAGVVHRDVKPGNVLWDGGRAVVVDFGIAALTDARVTALTHSGAVVGTQPYMAPEVFAGRPVTPAVDLWALGVTLYELVEGQRPFRAGNPEALMRAILDAPMPPPAHAGPLTPLLSALLGKDPAARPTAAAAAGMLPPPMPGAPPVVASPAAAGEPPTVPLGARPGSAPPPGRGSGRGAGRDSGRGFVRGRRAVIAAVAGVLLAGGAVAAVLLPNHHSAGPNKIVAAFAADGTTTSSEIFTTAQHHEGVLARDDVGGGLTLFCARGDVAEQVADDLRKGASGAQPTVRNVRVMDARHYPAGFPPALAARFKACADAGK
ncbi:serine/threonine-protein kinase [Streptomyces sp. HPF1205]|uniref:serine/threonine-protein kinase n=1 Tax=Streptomyces sp. HPF1205 TaxID=2873262 RepID=UPI001CED76C0|nr:serine/threonine-protein kinase [Streptomyces sp. HPF1205]